MRRLAPPFGSQDGGGRPRAIVSALCVAISVLLVAVYLIGASIRPLVLVIGPDSWGYLRLAIHLDTGLPVGAIGTRSIGYPLFVAPILALRGQLPDIAVAQTLLVALMAVIAAAVNLRIHRVLGQRERSMFSIISTPLLVLAILSYEPTTGYAFSILPETLYGFLIFLCVFLCLEHAVKPNGTIRAILVVVMVFLAVWLVYVKPHAILFVSFLIGYVLYDILSNVLAKSWRHAIASTLAFVAAGVAASLLIIAPDVMLKRQFGRYAESFGALTFFCNHPAIVLPAVRGLGLPEAFTADMERVLQQTIDNGANGWPVLGVNGDDCVYRSPLRQRLGGYFGDDDKASLKFLNDAAIHGILMNPAGMARIVVREFAYGLAHPFPNLAEPMGTGRDVYDGLAQREAELIGRYGTEGAKMEGVVGDPLGTAAPALASFGRAILSLLDAAAAYLWLLIGVWAAILVGVSVRMGRARVVLRSARGMGIVVGAYLSSIAIVAVAHTFDIARYAEAIAPLAMLAMVVSLASLLAATAQTVAARPLREAPGRDL